MRRTAWSQASDSIESPSKTSYETKPLSQTGNFTQKAGIRSLQNSLRGAKRSISVFNQLTAQ